MRADAQMTGREEVVDYSLCEEVLVLKGADGKGLDEDVEGVPDVVGESVEEVGEVLVARTWSAGEGLRVFKEV